jgi:hypothetical protein
MTALVVITLGGLATNFAATDWDGDPDTPDVADIVSVQPAGPEIQVLLRNQARIPRQDNRNLFATRMLIVEGSAMPSLQNFCCVHKGVRERAPPPLVQIK